MEEKQFYVSLTYINIVTAEDEDDAANIVERQVVDGKLVPNDIEVEECEDNKVNLWEYDGIQYDSEYKLLNELVKVEEIMSYEDWINDTYSAYDIVEDNLSVVYLEQRYWEYQMDMLEYLTQIGKVKEIK
jgi:hypothetical protein